MTQQLFPHLTSQCGQVLILFQDDDVVAHPAEATEGEDRETESKQLEDLIDLAKKHTRNPPDLRAKKSSVGTEANSHPSVVSPFDLTAAAHANSEHSQNQHINSEEMKEMIFALQQYVNKLKGQQENLTS